MTEVSIASRRGISCHVRKSKFHQFYELGRYPKPVKLSKVQNFIQSTWFDSDKCNKKAELVTDDEAISYLKKKKKQMTAQRTGYHAI